MGTEGAPNQPDQHAGGNPPQSAAASPEPATGARAPIHQALDFAALRQVPMSLQVEIGRTVMTLGEILDELDVGTTIRLDRHAGDPVEVYVNGTLFARAEVVVVQDQLGVKIIELIDSAQGARPSGLR
jgi:flagellar motor switch protein FliN/FliY